MFFLIYIKVFKLDIIMQLDISARQTHQSSNNNHLSSHEKSIIKKKKYKNR